MYYALNIYYVVFSIFSSPLLLQYWPNLRGALFQYKGMHFFVCVVAFVTLSYILEASLFIHTEKWITLLLVLLQIQSEVYSSGKI